MKFFQKPNKIPNITSQGINLLPERTFEEQPTGEKIFIWLVGVGRVLIIVTEMTAILVWLSRFRLDYQITTLQENIEENAALVQSSARFEETFRDYQHRLLLADKVESERFPISLVTEKISSLIPQDIILSSLVVRQGEIGLSAQANRSLDFAKLLETLLSQSEITEVSLQDTHYNRDDNTYEFTLNLKTSEKFGL